MEGFLTPLIVTHAYSFASRTSTIPHRTTSMALECSSTTASKMDAIHSFGTKLMPVNYRRRAARLVSYYALFQGMAASKPTS